MSASIERIPTRDEVFQEVGTVVELDGDELVVATTGGRYRSRRALSCFLAPQLDDEVLIASHPTAGVYILAVLERTTDEGLALEVDGDLALRVADGKLTIAAAGGVDVVSSEEVSMTSTKRVTLRAPEGRVFFDRLAYLGRKVVAETEQLKTFATAVETVAERVVERLGRSYRFIEKLDHLRAKNIDHAAEENLRLRGENTLVTANQIAKVDADQIHLG